MTAQQASHDEAAAWLARLLAPDCTPAEHLAFERWCIQDQQHADAYATVAGYHGAVATLGDDPLIRNATRGARHSVRSRRKSRSKLGRRVALAVAAVLVLAIGVNVNKFQRAHVDQQRHVTAIGEQRTLDLADGTRVFLDTNTALDVRYGRSSRELILEYGRIDVDVGVDPERPFSVSSGRGIVRDIGTEFQVARFGEDVSVTLVSGLVSVSLAEPVTDGASERLLTPGQALHFGSKGALGEAVPIELDDLRSWTQGTLVFKERRLVDLLAEMNRYSSTRIRIDDPALGELRVSGVFRVGDQPSLLQALQSGWSIQATRESTQDIVLTRGSRH